MLSEKTAGIISLGCSKNLVDSEYMLGALHRAGYRIVPESNAEIVVINTCGFIKDAIKESHEVIRELVERKKKGGCKKLIVAGCLPLRDYKELMERFPEIDRIVGSYDIYRLPEILKGTKRVSVCGKIEPITPAHIRLLTSMAPYSYLKISEGCSNNCTYCTIPMIKGPLHSRPIESVVEEAEMLVENGIKEINLISQDTTGYGTDLNKKISLRVLLERLQRIKGLKWIRLLYCHPANFTEDLVEFIRDSDKVCKYLDLPLQHISDRILKLMGRRIDRKSIENLLERLRKDIPGITLRTTFIVGFPGETDRDFEELFNFVKEFRFERMGAFKYSREDGTPAANFKEQLPESIKEERYNALMELQSSISLEKNQEEIGKEHEMIIERVDAQNNIVYGRISTQAPEVDGYTIVYNCKEVRKFLNVKIIDAKIYDLIGEAKEE